MKFPNKVVTYQESILSRFPILLRALQKGQMSPRTLYNQNKNVFENVHEFVVVLDCLFVLEKIDIDNKTGEIYYVG